MGLVNVDNVKIENYLDKPKRKQHSDNNEKDDAKIDVTKIKQLKKESKKKYNELLQMIEKLYKLQRNKETGDILITLETLKNKFNLN